MKSKKQKIKQLKVSKTNQRVYYFSGGWKRILIRFFDFVFLYVINIIFILLILFQRSGFSFSENIKYYQNTSFTDAEFASWRLIVLLIYLLFIHFIYFILIVKLTHGWTLFGKLFKVRIINKTDSLQKIKLKIISLFYKEVMIIFIPLFVLLIFAILGSAIEPQTNVIIKFSNVLLRTNLNLSFASQIFSTTFSIVFGTITFIQLIYFLNTIFIKNRNPWQDVATNLFVINFAKFTTLQPQKKELLNKKNYQNNKKKIPGAGLVFE